MLFVAPRLETERLVLRSLGAPDLDAYAAMAADPEVMRFIGGVVDRPQAWRQMALHAGHWALRGYGNWALERRADGQFVGRVGFWNPEGWPGIEIGWKLAREAWGKGYATEASRTAMDWAWTSLEVDRLISCIHPLNVASANVAKRLGMNPIDEMVLSGGPVVIYGMQRPAR
jgi:RimJ/RimL family protein N-acetyltransferase